jgi:hypothetical protein
MWSGRDVHITNIVVQAKHHLRCRGRPPNNVECRDGPAGMLPAQNRQWVNHAGFWVNLALAGNGLGMPANQQFVRIIHPCSMNTSKLYPKIRLNNCKHKRKES